MTGMCVPNHWRGLVCTERFQLRLTSEDRRRLRDLAEATQRSESDVLRLLVRVTPPTLVGPGVAPSDVSSAVSAERKATRSGSDNQWNGKSG